MQSLEVFQSQWAMPLRQPNRAERSQYAITDAGGNELSDRWLEAATIRAWTETIWLELHEAD